MFNPILQYEFGLSLTDNLIAYYNFNSNSNDITGKSPNGVVTNTTYVSGINNQCVNFANNTARVDIVDSNNFSFTNGGGIDIPFSVSMWVYFTAFTTAAGDYGNWLINKRNITSGGDEWQMVLYKDKFYFYKFDRVSNSINQSISSTSNPFTLNNWYNIIFTDNGSKTTSGMKIYINGVLLNTIDSSSGVYTGMNNGSAITRIGLNSWDLSAPYLRHQGNIDEIAIWKGRELKINEVNQLYNNGIGKFYPF